MPTHNVTLTPELDRFVAVKVETGLYSDASEVNACCIAFAGKRRTGERRKILRTAIGD
jgi:hypothetical protein